MPGDPSRNDRPNKNKGKAGFSGGKYATKSGDLSKSQLQRAGGAKAAAKRTVSQSQTSRALGSGKTLGPGGKPLTGSVKLANGQTAVYKGGKRVTNVKPAPRTAAPKAPVRAPQKVPDKKVVGNGRVQGPTIAESNAAKARIAAATTAAWKAAQLAFRGTGTVRATSLSSSSRNRDYMK